MLPTLPQHFHGSPILPEPPSTGDTLLASNLDLSAPGILRRTPLPYECGTMPFRPIAADRRDDDIYLFGQEDDGTLCLAGYINKEYDFVPDGRALGHLDGYVRDSASAGSFLILLTSAGSLAYLRWDKSTSSYSYLADMPQIPDISVTFEEAPALAVTIPEVTFKTPYTDMRQGIDTDTQRRVSEAVIGAYREAEAAAAATQFFTRPVYMRLALRLWDGKAIALSAPRKLTPSFSTLPTSRIMLPLKWDDTKQGFSGTAAAQLQVRPFRPVLHADWTVPAEWRDLIMGLEIWISEQADPLRPGEQAQVWEHHDTSGNYLTSLLPVKTADTYEAEMLEAPLAMATSPLLDLTDLTITLRSDLKYNSEILSYETSEPLVGRVNCILGYSGHLHIGIGSSLITMTRDNPFVQTDSTTGVGGEVTAIRPHICGGGAYTRQYLYLATPCGITALTLAPDGTHTNCRMISQEVPRSPQVFLPTPEGVYAYTLAGSLLRIVDAKVTPILYEAEGINALAWSNRHAALWLICSPADGALILTDRNRLTAYTTTQPVEMVLPLLHPCLIVTAEHGGLHTLATLDRDATELQPTMAYRVIIPAPARHPFIRLTLTGSDIDLTASITPLLVDIPTLHTHTPLTNPLYEADIIASRPLSYDLPLPTSAPYCLLSLQGHTDTLHFSP